MKKMRFSLDISPEKYIAYYEGAAKFVRVYTEEGLSLKFPASELQKYITRDGVQGRFEILFDDKHKLVSLKRI